MVGGGVSRTRAEDPDLEQWGTDPVWKRTGVELDYRNGDSVMAVVPNLLVLAGFAAVFFLIGTRSLQWE